VLPATVARHELLGQPLHRVAIVAGTLRGHGPFLSLGQRFSLRGPAGDAGHDLLQRSRAQIELLLAADLGRSSIRGSSV
jgi:hypothetical protein